MRDIDQWLREPRRGPVNPKTCIVCACLQGQVIAAARTDDPMLAVTTLQAMQVHKKVAHHNWVKRLKPTGHAA